MIEMMGVCEMYAAWLPPKVSSTGCVCYNGMDFKSLVLIKVERKRERERGYSKSRHGKRLSLFFLFVPRSLIHYILAIMSVHGTLRRIRSILNEQRRFRVDAPQIFRELTHSDPPSKWVRCLMQGTECYCMCSIFNLCFSSCYLLVGNLPYAILFSIKNYIEPCLIPQSKPLPTFFWCLMSLDAARALHIHAIYNHLFSYAIYVDPFASYLFTYTPHAKNNPSEGK